MHRKGTMADLQLLADLERKCFTRFWEEEDLRKELEENPFSQTWILEDEGNVVGYLIFWKIFEQASIVRVGILPEYRLRGFGENLMKEALLVLKRENLEQVNLEVDEGNTPAIRLYQKLGFVPVNRIPHYYQDGADALRMICYLQV